MTKLTAAKIADRMNAKPNAAKQALRKVVNHAIANGSPVVTEIKAPTSIEVKMEFSRETPGTYRYDSIDPDAPITSLYIRKSGMPGGEWKSITVTVR